MNGCIPIPKRKRRKTVGKITVKANAKTPYVLSESYKRKAR